MKKIRLRGVERDHEGWKHGHIIPSQLGRQCHASNSAWWSGLNVSPASVWTLPHSLSFATSSRAATRTRDRDIPTLTSSGADLSCGDSSSRAAPIAIEEAGDVDMEACPIATSTKDVSGAPPSICPTTDTATYMDGGSSLPSPPMTSRTRLAVLCLPWAPQTCPPLPTLPWT